MGPVLGSADACPWWTAVCVPTPLPYARTNEIRFQGWSLAGSQPCGPPSGASHDRMRRRRAVSTSVARRGGRQRDCVLSACCMRRQWASQIRSVSRVASAAGVGCRPLQMAHWIGFTCSNGGSFTRSSFPRASDPQSRVYAARRDPIGPRAGTPDLGGFLSEGIDKHVHVHRGVEHLDTELVERLEGSAIRTH